MSTGHMTQLNRHAKRSLRSVSNRWCCHFRPSPVTNRRNNTQPRHPCIKRKLRKYNLALLAWEFWEKFDEATRSADVCQLQTFDRVWNIHTASSFQGLVAIILPSSTVSARNKMPKVTVRSCHGCQWWTFAVLRKRPPLNSTTRCPGDALCEEPCISWTSSLCWGKAIRTSRGKTKYPRAWKIGVFQHYYCHPLSGTRIGDVVKRLIQSVEGCMERQIFPIRRHAPSGRKRVQPDTCSVFHTWTLCSVYSFCVTKFLYSNSLNTLGGCHPDSHRAICAVATTIAQRDRLLFLALGSSFFSATRLYLYRTLTFISSQA